MKKLIFTLAIALMVCSSGNLFAQSTDRMSEVKAFAQQRYQQVGRGVYEPVSATYNNPEYLDNYNVTYTYDEQCRLFQEQLHCRFGTYQTTYDYTETNQVSVALEKYQNGDDWYNKSNQTYAYDTDDRIEEIITQKWNDTDWVNEKKESYTYSENVTSILYSIWNGAWDPKELYTITYSTDGYEILNQNWNGSTWGNSKKIEITLNENHGIIKEVSYEWRWGNWYESYVTEYVYGGLVYTSIHVSRNGGEEFLTINYGYDGHGNATHAKVNVSPSQLMNYKLVVYMPYANNTKSKEIKILYGEGYPEVISMNYDEIFLFTNEMTENTAFNLYPNPANGMISVDGEGFEKAEIYNIAGQKVMESSNAQIDVKALQAGVYMVKVFGNGSSEMLRVVVK